MTCPLGDRVATAPVSTSLRCVFSFFLQAIQGLSMSILGTGVDALSFQSLDMSKRDEKLDSIKAVPLRLIKIGQYQPRKKDSITLESIHDLIASVKEHGILQPVILRYVEPESYELIAGERRLRAAIELDLSRIPAVVKKIDKRQANAIAIIENIQREQLSFLEEADALLKLKDEYLISVEAVSQLIGKPRTTVANLIRVATKLSHEGRGLLEKNLVDYGHIRAVLRFEETLQNLVLNHVVAKNLSVRATEDFVRERGYIKLVNNEHIKEPKLDISRDERDDIVYNLSSRFQTKVGLKVLSNGKVRVSMDFSDIDSAKKLLNESK